MVGSHSGLIGREVKRVPVPDSLSRSAEPCRVARDVKPARGGLLVAMPATLYGPRHVQPRGTPGMTDKPTVGFVGVGDMGWPMAACLVKAGFTVNVLESALMT